MTTEAETPETGVLEAEAPEAESSVDLAPGLPGGRSGLKENHNLAYRQHPRPGHVFLKCARECDAVLVEGPGGLLGAPETWATECPSSRGRCPEHGLPWYVGEDGRRRHDRPECVEGDSPLD